MALRVSRCMLVALVPYAAALECARRPAIARLAAAATGCMTTTATAADVPMVGRFARNEGAKEFVGDWRLETTTGCKGRLVFRGDGDCSTSTGEALRREPVPKYSGGKQGIQRLVHADAQQSPTTSLILDGTIEEDGAARMRLRPTRRWAQRVAVRRPRLGILSRRGGVEYCSSAADTSSLPQVNWSGQRGSLRRARESC